MDDVFVAAKLLIERAERMYHTQFVMNSFWTGGRKSAYIRRKHSPNWKIRISDHPCKMHEEKLFSVNYRDIDQLRVALVYLRR